MTELLALLACVLPSENAVPTFAQAKRMALQNSVQSGACFPPLLVAADHRFLVCS